MNKIIVLATLLLFVLGCTKEEDETILEPVSETFEITSEQYTVKPLELVKISSNDITFNLEAYKGSINDIEIDLIKTGNSELIFMVPGNFAAGSAKLEIVIENRKGELSFSIQGNEVQNVETVINEELINPFNGFTNDLEVLISNNSNSLVVNEQLETAKQMLENFITKFNTLSNEEKMEVAKFYNANPVFTSDFLSLSTQTVKTLNGNSDYDCFKLNANKVVYTTISILTFINYLPHLSRVGPYGSIAALSGFVAGVYAAVAIISAAQEHLINDCFLPFENLLKDGSGNTDNFELNNASYYSFLVISRDRKLISADLNSSNSLLASTVRKWNNAKQKWNTLKNGINTIISSASNWFSSWFGSGSESFQTITYDFEDVPSSSDEIESEGDSEFITIEDFPGDVEVEYSIASDNSINLKFRADESTLPRTVSGKIKYYDGDFTTANDFSVTLNIIDFELTGIWTLKFYKDSTRTELSQTNYINFQNGAGDFGLPLYYIDSNGDKHDQTGSSVTWKQSFNSSLSRLTLINMFWGFPYRFIYDPQNPNNLIGEAIDLSDRGFYLELTKQ